MTITPTYKDFKQVRKFLQPYGDIAEDEVSIIALLCLEAEEKQSIKLELEIIHRLFRRRKVHDNQKGKS